MMAVAKLFLLLGVVLVILGGLLYLAARLNLPLGRLPGDIYLQRGNLTCMFPLVSSIAVSVLLTILLNLIVRFLNK